MVTFYLPTAARSYIVSLMMVPTTEELIPTRATLILRLKNYQDQSSWQVFFDTYWGLVYGVAVKAGLTKSEAEDVVQETMISIAKHISNFKYDPGIGSFKRWLLNMTRWRIADQLRKREPLVAVKLPADGAGTETGEENGQSIDPSSYRLDELWDAEWEKNLLDAALAKVKRRLDPQKYQVFDFYVNKEWPPEKVAESFGISVSQVYLAKHRVTELIKEEVRRLQIERI
jgi:RNA polymerase sigma factor (sigma-70 family)